MSLAAFFLMPPATAPAGTIGFQIDTTVDTADGLSARIRLRQTGDEAASKVVPTVVFQGRSVSGKKIPSLGPEQENVWNLKLRDTDLPRGIYTLVVRVAYTDANSYPFEVISAANFKVDAKPGPRIKGFFDIPSLDGSREYDAKVTINIPKGRRGPYDVELITSSGIEIRKNTFTLQGGEGRRNLGFRIRNKTLLPGTRMELFALVTGRHEGAMQTDLLRGILTVDRPKAKLTTERLLAAAIALAAILLLLELVAVRED